MALLGRRMPISRRPFSPGRFVLTMLRLLFRPALPKNLAGGLDPKVGNIEIAETTPDSVTIRALVNVTNPTPYTAHIPLVSIHLLSNGSLLGVAKAENLDISKGNNTNLAVSAVWHPSLDGPAAVKRGRDFLSEYLSGFNTTVTVKAFRDSFPGQPLIGEALSKLSFNVTAPRLGLPDDGGGDNGPGPDNKGRFIRDATFHVLSSTATFTLVSPLQHNTLYIDSVNATALYNHTEPIGRIEYDLPFAAPPGATRTPKLPVQWSLDSVGYEKLRKALGGELKLDARAVVGVRIGQWTETVWYWGKGIGASVRL
jgi:hypothetical protein